jgi:hypothetical protein
MSRELQTGDVIEITKGMRIYAPIPIKLLYTDSPVLTELRVLDIEVGKIRNNYVANIENLKERVAKKIQDVFISETGLQMSDDVAQNFVIQNLQLQMNEQYDGSEFKGEYLVIRTAFEGGYDKEVYYPDGHHVYAKMLQEGKYDPDGREISFYQSGEFTAMILPEDIQAVRKMTLPFV